MRSFRLCSSTIFSSQTKRSFTDRIKASVCAAMIALLVVGTMGVPASAAGISGSTGASVNENAASSKSRTTSLAPEDAKLELQRANQQLNEAKAEKERSASAYSIAVANYNSSLSTRSASEESARQAAAAASAAFDKALSEAFEAASAAKNALNAAQIAYDDATAMREAALNDYANAQKAEEEARAAYEEALALLPSDMKPALEELESAKEALANAKAQAAGALSAFENAKTGLASAQANATAAKAALAEAERSHASANATYTDAKRTYDAAVSALNAAESEEEIAALSSELESARTALSTAQENERAANKNLADAQEALVSANNNAANAQTEYDEAKAAYDAFSIEALEVAKEEAETAYNAALEEYGTAKDLADKTSEQLEAATSVKEAAEAKRLETNYAWIDAYEVYKAAKLEYDAAINGVEGHQEFIVSLYDFFVDMNSTSALAEFTRFYNGVEQTEINQATESGKTGDATDYRNVLRALNTIRDLNSIRSSLGLSELKVIDVFMAHETVSTNWSSQIFAHSKGCGGENLAWGWVNPLSGWYDKEKRIWDNAVETKQYTYIDSTTNKSVTVTLPDNIADLTPTEIRYDISYEFYEAVGHYFNCIAPNYMYTGAAISNDSDTIYNVCYGQSYGYYNALPAGESAYSVDEWESRFLNWVAQKAAESTIPTAQDQYKFEIEGVLVQDTAISKFAAADYIAGNATSDYTAALKADEAAQADLTSKTEIMNASKSSFDSASLAYENADSDHEAAALSLASLKGTLDRAIEAIDLANTEVDQAVFDAKNATNAVQTAISTLNSKSANYEAIVEKHNKLVSEVSNAYAPYAAAQAVLDEAETALQMASSSNTAAEEAVTNATSRVNYTEAYVATTNSAFQSAQDRLDAAQAAVDTFSEVAEEFNIASDELDRAIERVDLCTVANMEANERMHDCIVALSSATKQSENTDNKLARAQALSYEDALQNPVEDPDFAFLNEYVEKQREAEALIPFAVQNALIAEKAMNEAKSNYAVAYDAWTEAATIQKVAQANYDTHFAKSGKWVKSGKRWWYRYSDGTYPSSTKLIINNATYRFDASGWMRTGWVKENGNWYYHFNSGAQAIGWFKQGGKWYYLDPNNNGAMKTGWYSVGGKQYYSNSSGAMLTGWIKSGKYWYYANSSGVKITGWKKIGSKWYYLDPENNGIMKTGWLTETGSQKQYYLSSSGAMVTGWFHSPTNSWHYFYGNGVMAKGAWVGKYYLDSTGVWTRSR